MEVTIYGIDLANILDITGQRTLKDMKFEAYIEIDQDDGRLVGQIVQLSDIIVNSISTELRRNLSLRKTLSHKHDTTYKVV